MSTLLPYSRITRPLVPGLLALASTLASAQQQPAAPKVETKVDELPEMIISEPKLGRDLLSAPLSATVVSGDVIEKNAIRTTKDAAIYSPNTFFTEFSARKLSSPRFRGIGASPANPGVTIYLDGVPQLNSNSASLELLDIDQIDFVRGPQGALFGRNTVGGLVNITSRKPSLDTFGGQFESTFGNYNLYDFRGRINAPLIQDQLGFSFAGGYNERDGYTNDTVSGTDVDNRSAYFGKAQFLWQPSDELEVRFILAGESSNDGDYALTNLNSLRRNKRETSRSFLGSVERDVLMPTLQVTYHADAFDFTSTTGFVHWRTEDITDIDYSNAPIPQSIRRNEEEMHSFTQEFRFSSPAEHPVELSDSVKLAWQAGFFYFHSQYDQAAASAFDGLAPITLFQAKVVDMEDWGIGTYAQGTLTFADRLSVTAGLRYDYESKDADIALRNDFLGFAARTRNSGSFDQVTPQAAISYKITPDILAYFTFAGGYKAGGFNAVTVPNLPQFYDQEKSWNYELGLKGKALDNKLAYSAALFYTDWQDLQLTSAATPADYYIVNAGDASTKGIEISGNYDVNRHWSIFGSAGWQNATFHGGSVDGGANISGNKVPFTPDYTAAIGTQVQWEVGGGYNIYARGDVQFLGAFDYDSVNAVGGQDAYTLANFRVGVRNETWFIEGFVNNAFNTDYIPMAIPFGPGNYVGEAGAPATFGVRVGVKF